MKNPPFSFEVRMRLKSLDPQRIQFLKHKTRLLADTYGLVYSSISLPVDKSKFTVLKSPHVNKKAKDQFEIRVINCLITLKGLTLSSPFFFRLAGFESEDGVAKLSLSLLKKDV